MTLKAGSLEHLDDVLAEWKKIISTCREDDLGDLGDAEGTRFITRALAVVERVSGHKSVYAARANAIVEQGGFVGYVARHVAGVVDSLRADAAAGYLEGFAELIHGELFGDFLEMADHLLGEGYKDAAAVVAGSSLEAHLRQLCVKHSISTTLATASGVRPKKADQLNSDLAAGNAISKLDQKNISAWLDLRNKAAHGHYAEYQPQQVGLMVSGVRDFVTRLPA